MLKVTEHGVTINLTGKSSAGNGMLWFAVALLVGAVGVVFAMSFLSVKLAIGALALLVIGSFIFNHFKQKQQTCLQIGHGVLDVRAGMLTHNSGIKQERIVVTTSDRLECHGRELTIFDNANQKKCHISGFETDKEVQVMQKVLQGQTLNKRNANIKMQSN